MHHLKFIFAFYLSLLVISFSFAQKNKAVISIDNFDKPSKALAQTNWFTYNDNSDGGKSTSANSIVKESANKNQYIQFTYTLDQAKCMWAPYTALSCNINSNVMPTGMKAISYQFKGNAHTLILKTANIKDYCYYNISIPASTIWTTVSIPISELRQPSWGQKVSLDINTFAGLSWQVSGNTNDTGMISIDAINLLYNSKPAINVKPVVQKSMLNSDVTGIDNFDQASTALGQSNWFTFTDNSYGGRSTGANTIVKESTGNNQYMQFTYTLDQAKCIWSPFSALSCNITSYA